MCPLPCAWWGPKGVPGGQPRDDCWGAGTVQGAEGEGWAIPRTFCGSQSARLRSAWGPALTAAVFAGLESGMLAVLGTICRFTQNKTLEGHSLEPSLLPCLSGLSPERHGSVSKPADR